MSISVSGMDQSVERPAGPDLVYLRELRSDTFMGEAV